MTAHVFDTSALLKLYHPEPGTAAVEALLAEAGGRRIISRLTRVELHSALAKLVRIGRLRPGAYHLIVRRFRSDLRAKRFDVIRPLVRHHDAAEELIDRHGLTHNLRTQDAIRLAVALGENTTAATPVTLVTSDVALGVVATLEGLTVINPDLP